MIFGRFWNCKKWNLAKKFFVKLIYLISQVFFGPDFFKFSGPLCIMKQLSFHISIFLFLYKVLLVHIYVILEKMLALLALHKVCTNINLILAICLCPNCYFIDFSTSLLFPSGKTLGLRFFSLNSRVILKSSRPKAENFSILPKNLMKKIEIQVFSLTETTMTRKIV